MPANSAPTIDELKTLLNLKPHPEGGFFAETFRDPAQVHTIDPASTDKNASTAIYFMLTNDSLSHLHRLAVSSETWHHYLGGSVTIVELEPKPQMTEMTVTSPQYSLRTTRLGKDVLAGERLQHVVPPGTWFGSYPNFDEEGKYALVGCTVAPGFEFADFELAKREEMVKLVGGEGAADKQTLKLVERMCAL
ncbi:RmlC-like cupin domain-containing protein [Jimgerdemannia flammicorona]|uniref:RmlC-like cupin domain-containing protein n=1 Tax=Jimgerdemannia flammicorona TaxID=994334 RepID=A0A433QXR3_9FUNG|nr:RmlC-like cupin domain-containing protein [Jimgerdemannia flammicorona]